MFFCNLVKLRTKRHFSCKPTILHIFYNLRRSAIHYSKSMSSIIYLLKYLNHFLTYSLLPTKNSKAKIIIIAGLSCAIILRAKNNSLSSFFNQFFSSMWKNRAFQNIDISIILIQCFFNFCGITQTLLIERCVNTNNTKIIFVFCPCVDFLILIIYFWFYCFDHF